MHALRTSPVFALVVLTTLALFALIGVVLVQPNLIAGLLGHELAGHISGHFRFLHHRVHDLTFGFIVATSAVGMLAQLRTPSKNVGGQLMAVIPWGALVLTFALTKRWVFAPAPIFAALTIVATILHPSGNFFRSFSVSQVNRVMLALLILAAVPLLAFAMTNIGLQRTVTNDHAALGHYGFMAAFSFTVMGVGLLASLRPEGWRLPAWVAGFLPVLLGVTSLVYPNLDSSLGLAWALVAMAWGIVFVATAEITREQVQPIADIGVGPDRVPTTSTPRWVYVLAIIAVILAVLFVILHLAGGGIRGH